MNLKKISLPLARIALFVVYFWFGILKIVGQSPASPLVARLLEKTLPFISFHNFIICLGMYEMIIGILFIIPGLERVAFLVWIPHIIITTGPIILLPGMTWQAWFVPTLEGQYIIKNLLILALAVTVGSQARPRKTTQ